MSEREEELLRKRFQELALRADKQYRPLFTGFLSPPEAQWALQAGRKAGVDVRFSGGYEDAERKMACFLPLGEEEPDFPFCALSLTWPHQTAPGHRDILGAAMGMGVQRHCLGDIALEQERAILFVTEELADHICQGLTSAGRIKLQVRLLEELPEIQPPEAKTLHDTVASLRLDAVVASGFSLSRAKAADLIAAGRVKLRHLPTLRTDAQVEEGDSISAMGLGRIRLDAVGSPTKKGRIPLTILRYGEKKH
ncbi:MAG: RNA-binding protein [Clostridiales bacterium]|nr:RNA-binding protein [Clostridiales bacterium]